ncbi:DUF192 domain-containing protein [Halobacteria archaeon AArc-m2/3/4]|uniref:DUF192 domain-containing protein n=1 Tax=Natronoglomus mannanivorans TaxID=2979990 RepID=A0AAP2YX19_9EURY|nr:DUF192 domain-containing protein [Halobacteria archaeon AArc-xg1-1]MCU4973577.1 DUF192 domain-containing protein [Halobacteria archaeon AArc-m2/3/4]
MTLERASKLLLALALALLVGFVLVEASVLPAPWTDDRAEVRIVGDDGTTKAEIDAEVADTYRERYVGLSDHESLETGEGMLFVHRSEGDRTYVMRDMDFDIDIVFVGSDGEITTIHHARAPEPGEDGEDLQYSGRAKWVLEVPGGYANETGLEVGDELVIDETR